MLEEAAHEGLLCNGMWYTLLVGNHGRGCTTTLPLF